METKQIKNPFESNNRNAVALIGKQNFELLCTVCHGETGKGDGVTLEYLNPKPANLTSKRIQDQTDGEIYWKITTGRPPMQSYVNVLSSSEIWQVVTYIKSFEVE
ncbi:MAG: cytochrome c [Bacteroidetes bacterium]|nr:cytochrome c [Bacteroidota bacterium]MDA1122058.1 cytochrome c [Bacteroidota bacterium]